MNSFFRWYSKIVRKRLRIPRIHSKAGTDRKEWRSQWRTSCWTRRATENAEVCADFWSIQGDFIYHHHTEPRVQLYVPKEETFLIPLIWMCYKRIDWRLLECRFEQGFVRFVKRIHKVHFVEREASKRIFVVRVEIDKDSNDFQTRLCMARSMDENW